MVGGRWMVLRLGVAMALAAAAGMAALVGVAAMSARPLVFLGASLAVFLAATVAGVALATRRLPRGRRGRARLIAVTAGALAGMAIFGLTVLLPVGDPRLPPAPVAGQRSWTLPTGSRIAYVHLPADSPRRPTPVVFLHGGPGIADMAGDAAYFGQLTGDGFDVWVYDQVGTGRSSRLADPSGYTIARQVADLEAIRRRIGADRLVLVGHSWGGQVAAAYLAAHPGHVARVVFSSPGPLAPALDDGSDAGVRTRLSTGQQLRQYLLVARPRVLLAWTLLQVNPRAAHALVGDAEMDARNDRVYNHSPARAHCSGAPPGPALHRPALARLPIPALVVKGSCDYLSWATAVDYRQSLPNAQLAYLHRAGHNAYQDQPAAYLGILRALLTGRPLPVTPWTAASQPTTRVRAPRTRPAGGCLVRPSAEVLGRDTKRIVDTAMTVVPTNGHQREETAMSLRHPPRTRLQRALVRAPIWLYRLGLGGSACAAASSYESPTPTAEVAANCQRPSVLRLKTLLTP